MHILRKNYFEAELRETFDGGGTPQVDTRLLQIKEALIKGQAGFPNSGERHLKWMYYCLINNIQTTFKPSNDIAIDKDDSHRVMWFYDNAVNVPDDFNEWIAKYCAKESGDYYAIMASKESNGIFNSYRDDGAVYTNNHFGYHYVSLSNHGGLNQWYQYHKRAIETLQASQNIPIQTVRGFLENPQWPTGTDLSTPNNLPAKIENIVNDLPEPPSIEEAQAMAEAAAVDPNDYVSVDSYAKGLSTKASKAIAVIGHFSIVACPAPSQTIDAIEDIMDHRKTIDPNEIDMMVSQPKTFLGVPTWRMRPLSFQETPIYEMVQMAQNLPDCAIADSEMHANHIKVLQAGLDIVHGYDDALRLYIHALEKRKAEIDADKPDVDIEDVSTRAIADVILKDDISNRLGDLKASRAFVRAHAGNFATTMLVVKKSKREKEHMAELAANILLPLQQVQRAFLAYQSSKFGEAAGVVNGILELSDGPIVEKAHDAKTIMEQSLGTLELMIERMQNDLRASNATIIDITQKTDEAAAKGEAKEIKMPQP